MSWDKSWEKLYRNRGWGEYPNEELIKFVARNFYKHPKRNKIKILELGCGIGSNLWYFAKESFKVYGIDGSKTAVSKSIKKLNKEFPNWKGQVTIGDIIDIQYPDNYFDAVVDLEAITHNSFEDSIKIYNESYRVLKKNGKFFSRTFSVGTWGDETGKKLGTNSWKVTEGPMKGHCNFIRFTKKNQIKILLNKFNIINIDKISLSVNNENNKIIEWLIYATKS